MADMQNTNDIADSGDKIGKLEAVSETTEQDSAAKTEQKSVVEDVIPDEFKGKTASEIAKEALFYRKQMGQQANELGEVRRLADELIKSALHKPNEQNVKNDKEIDLFDSPKEAIRREVESNPAVMKALDYAEKLQKEFALQKLANLHPDYREYVVDEKFMDWVNKSNTRKLLFKQANEFNVDSADELLSTYKELHSLRNVRISDTEKTARSKALNAASVDTGGSGEKGKKIFSRTKLMELMLHDRKKYDAMQDEIMLAYSEGRVKT